MYSTNDFLYDTLYASFCRAMSRTPLIRRILPFVYATIFLVVAPFLLLYTAGYEYNSKKQQVERSGTLIVDTTPRSARVIIDGVDTDETTPATFQRLALGTHRVKLERAGYASWERDIDIKPEQVTFANNLWLWKIADPELVVRGSYLRIASDPQGTRIALLATSTQGLVISYLDSNRGVSATTLLNGSLKDVETVAWDASGKAVLIQDVSGMHAWWSKPQGTSAPFVEALPVASYRWTSDGLVGVYKDRIYRLDPELGHLERDTLKQETVDEFGSYALTRNTSTNGLLLTSEKLFSDQTYAIGPGTWLFAGIDTKPVVLRDGSRLLAIDTRATPPQAIAGTGDLIVLNPETASSPALLLGKQELWLWDFFNTPELLRRESGLAPSALWHRSGLAVFFANQTDVFATNLYHKTDRTTQSLAHFERIRDLTTQKRALLVSATRNGVAGLYALTIE